MNAGVLERIFRRLGGLLLATLLPAGLGCASFYDELFINPDGSGLYRLTVVTSSLPAPVNLAELRTLLELRAARIGETTGLRLKSLELRREDPGLVIEATAEFPNLGVFAHPALSLSDDAQTWCFVVPREARYEDGRFVARLLRGTAPVRDDPIRRSLKGREARFSVHLPSEIRKTNGISLGRTATWVFGLESLCDLPIELTAQAEPQRPWGALALGLLILLALGILIVSLRRSPTRPPAQRV
jgi:hypothetical protein